MSTPIIYDAVLKQHRPAHDGSDTEYPAEQIDGNFVKVDGETITVDENGALKVEGGGPGPVSSRLRFSVEAGNNTPTRIVLQSDVISVRVVSVFTGVEVPERPVGPPGSGAYLEGTVSLFGTTKTGEEVDFQLEPFATVMTNVENLAGCFCGIYAPNPNCAIMFEFEVTGEPEPYYQVSDFANWN